MSSTPIGATIVLAEPNLCQGAPRHDSLYREDSIRKNTKVSAVTTWITEIIQRHGLIRLISFEVRVALKGQLH